MTDPHEKKNNQHQPLLGAEKKEACGLTGIVGHPQAINLTALGLFALQHRGEESFGIAYTQQNRILSRLSKGLVQQFFTFEENTKHPAPPASPNPPPPDMDTSRSSGAHAQPNISTSAIGHTRYSITGDNSDRNIQPMTVDHLKGTFALAHNGNLTNSRALKYKLEQEGAIFQTTMDSELFIHLIAKSSGTTFKDCIIEALHQVEGAYSLLILEGNKIYAMRDPHGFRPLSLGEISLEKPVSHTEGQTAAADTGESRKSLVAVSETCAFDFMGAKNLGTVRPGELAVLHADGRIEREQVFSKEFRHAHKIHEARCIFELIYFARPDSMIFDESVYLFRKKIGRILAQEAPVDADIVVPIPDSGNIPALGYSEESGIPLEFAITRNHYTSRSFIQPSQARREQMVRLKLNPIRSLIEGKRILIVDDSIVRGTTTKAKIESLRSVGAREVHMRVASPPIISGCYYGIDFPDKNSLIAKGRSLDEIRLELGLDSLAYISHDGMLQASIRKNSKAKVFCTACFTGHYPTTIDPQQRKDACDGHHAERETDTFTNTNANANTSEDSQQSKKKVLARAQHDDFSKNLHHPNG